MAPRYIIGMKYLILLTMMSVSASASDDWLCKTQATERRGYSFYSCGVSTGVDENSARSSAFDHAQNDFAKICRSSDDCVGQDITVHPSRTECEENGTGFVCRRLIIFTITQLGRSNPNNRPDIVPYRADRVSKNVPQISVGMSKADLLEKFGKPDTIYTRGGSLSFYYGGPMCDTYGMFAVNPCVAYLNGDKVTSFHYFKPEYTNLLK